MNKSAEFSLKKKGILSPELMYMEKGDEMTVHPGDTV